MTALADLLAEWEMFTHAGVETTYGDAARELRAAINTEVGPTFTTLASADFLPALLRAVSRKCHNGAGDPWQEFYDHGAAPLLERMADRLEAQR